MTKYLVRHYVTADFVAEKIVDESEIDSEKNNLKQNTIPDGTFSFIMVEQSEKLIRTTYEKYDESLNNSDKERISHK
tara:strand:- start:448 stop:678 length:231 start_codon:yes stop_codon:yes gene_type:complete